MRSSSTSIVTGLLFTFGLVLVGSLLTAALLSLTDIQERSLPYFTYAINIISLLIGGYVTGRRCGGRGWYYGGLTGLVYFLLVLLIGFLGFDAPVSLITLVYLFAAFLIAAIGGIFGVNSTIKR
ncbi:TIGR04086 family membrane protein [Brevibacillus fulvus]|uniref:Membrane protein (TIGR04086 family) n=1 Tax=Brevibacillus fulvus TaxID=1125967 RepID=A0A938XYF2_9BACL|nr:putative membrane protein (TIGR04086 family) [Brevibacillus fulvus]